MTGFVGLVLAPGQRHLPTEAALGLCRILRPLPDHRVLALRVGIEDQEVVPDTLGFESRLLDENLVQDLKLFGQKLGILRNEAVRVPVGGRQPRKEALD